LLSIFRFYENKKKLYRYYNKGLKNNLLSNYKKAQKLNKIYFILSLISKKDVINSNFKNEVTILSNNFYFIQNIFNN
jgi:hypothetical protein